LITGVSSRRNHRLRRGNAAHHRRAQGQDPSSRRSSAAPVARRNLVAPHTAASHEDTSSDRSGASLACAALGRQRRWRYADRRSLAPPIGDRRRSASPKGGLAARAYPPRSHHNSLSLHPSINTRVAVRAATLFAASPKRRWRLSAKPCFACRLVATGVATVVPFSAASLRLSAGEAVLRRWWR